MSREDVAAAQGALLRAVLAGADVPPGFDAEVVRVEAAALLGKRRRIVRDIDPETAGALGERFAELFADYARGNPRRSGSRFREDAAAFAEWAVEHGHLPRARRRWWRKGR
ncbi:hypothetical protein [Actinokineospora cianjurensis]|uniref:SCO6045-like C-terminal domain-containing protein n=1 Tax=Actinokineospora cianjurensis TaxID=585224 RepID=A0A421BBA7_9PSEU|nr:hypothetical protein [Actinokineospora cianjurensis]RLK61644.1 hypothetical protein CLV68_2185 [Actinokineospora cianjurensis]